MALNLGDINYKLGADTSELKKASKALKKTGKEAKDTADETTKLSTTMKDLSSASVLALGPLSGLGARINAIGAITNRSSIAIAALFGGIAAGIVAMGALSKSVVGASLELERIQAGLIASTESTAAANKEFNFIASTAQKLGTDLGAAGREYAKLAAAARGTTLSGEKLRQIYLGISEAGVALRLNAQDITGAFRAIQQMISKGNVQAEELRGQLGERIPGAFQLAAKSMGVTTRELDKMLKKGEVLADDLLPRLARALRERFGEQAKEAANSLTAALAGTSTAWLLLRRSIDSVLGISDAFKSGVQGLRDTLNGLNRDIHGVVATTGAVVTGITLIFAPGILAGLVKLATVIRSVTIATTGLNIALSANPLVAAGTMLRRIAFAAAGAAISYGIFKAAVGDAKTVQEELIEEIDNTIEAHRRQGTVLQSTINKQKVLVRDQMQALQEQLRLQTRVLDEALKKQEELRKRTQRPGALQFALLPAKDIGQLDVARNEVNKLNTAIDNLRKRLEKLSTVEGVADPVRIIKDVVDVSEKRIAALRGQITATLEGTGVLRRYKQELQDIKATEAFRRELEKATPKITDIDVRVKEFTETLKQLRDAENQVATGDLLARIRQEIRDQRQLTEATSQGTLAVSSLNLELRNRTALEEWSKSLEKAGISSELAAALVDQLSASFKGLAAAQQTAAQAPILERIRKLTRDTSLMAKATDKGKEAVEDLNMQLRQRETLQQWREELQKAGVDATQAKALLDDLKKSLEELSTTTIGARGNFQQMFLSYRDVASTISSNLASWVVEGGKFEDTLKNLVKQLTQMVIQAHIFNSIMRGFGLTGAPLPIGGPGAPAAGPPVSVSTPPVMALTAPVATTTAGFAPQTEVGSGGPTIIIDARGADAGVEDRIKNLIRSEGRRNIQTTLRTIADNESRPRRGF